MMGSVEPAVAKLKMRSIRQLPRSHCIQMGGKISMRHPLIQGASKEGQLGLRGQSTTRRITIQICGEGIALCRRRKRCLQRALWQDTLLEGLQCGRIQQLAHLAPVNIL